MASLNAPDATPMGRAADRIDGKPSMTIAEYIEKDVKAKVMAGEDLPSFMTSAPCLFESPSANW